MLTTWSLVFKNFIIKNRCKEEKKDSLAVFSTLQTKATAANSGQTVGGLCLRQECFMIFLKMIFQFCKCRQRLQHILTVLPELKMSPRRHKKQRRISTDHHDDCCLFSVKPNICTIC